MTAEWAEDDLIPISALQHFLYCPRQCALIHVEQVFEENLYTLRGRAVHERAHEEGSENDGILRVERAMHLRHAKLGLVGVSDIVEFDATGTPFPVEYKSGSKKISRADSVQLGAQALCLEEMFGAQVQTGAIFYSTSKRRVPVKIDDALRDLVIETTARVRAMFRETLLPAPHYDARCPDCSLIDICQPKLLGQKDRINSEFRDLFSVEEAE